MLLRLLALILLVFATAVPAAAEPVRTDNVEVELHSSLAAVQPGQSFTIAFRQKINEHWHTYWRNPGDSGEATELTWQLPAGFAAGEMQWPAPTPLPFAMLVNYGYSDEVLFPVEITVPRNAPVGQDVTLNADAYWLVCSDVCIPEQATVSLTLPVAATSRPDSTWGPRIAEAAANLPQPFNGQAHVTAGGPAKLTLELADAASIRNPYFFPFSRDVLNHAAPQNPRVGPRGVSFDLIPGVAENLGRAELEGVVAFERQQGGAWVREAITINASPGATLSGTDNDAATLTPDFVAGAPEAVDTTQNVAQAPTDVPGFWTALLFAFLGGLILNIMPCVLPVLSIKALSIASGAHRGEAKREGLFFFAGVMTTFLALAGVLIALKAAGMSVGWGFQLQEPWFVGGLTVLFFLIGLNLLGAFEIGGSVQNVGQGLASKGGDAGAFFTGALAVVAATPCTAWFMAGAMGFAATQPAPAALAVFAMLGFGFALPFTALAFIPALQKAVPKPGPWMERVKQFLAFPMFATCAWLAWVLAGQAGATGVLVLLSVGTVIAFLVWALPTAKTWTGRGVALLFAALCLLTVAWMIRPSPVINEAWTPERVEELRAENRAVFVNFTADWCVTCKVNERAALASPRMAEAFAANGVAYLKGDWTDRDDSIAAELAQHGRAGVPLYLYYAPGAVEPVVLPQVLTEALVLQTISGGSE